MKESPIFVRTYDLLNWLIPHTLQFPRQQRFVLAQAVQQAAFALHEQLVQAAYATEPLPWLRQADVTLTRLRIYLRLCRDWKLLSLRQHAHAAGLVDEIGKMLGSWIKSNTLPAGPPAAAERSGGRTREARAPARTATAGD